MPEPLAPPKINAPLPVTSILPGVLERAARARALIEAGEPTVGFPTGVPTIDKECSGLQEGLHILAAEPGAGKTTLALQIARHGARRGFPTLYLTFDEGTDALSLKILCAQAGMSASRVSGGLVDPTPLVAAASVHHEVMRRIDVFAGVANLGASDIVRALGEQMKVHGARIGLLVVDYLQPWAATRRDGATEYRMAVGELIVELRRAALDLHCPVLAISAQNRSAQGEAKMSSLRESSDLEYSADSIWFLTHDKDRPLSPPRRGITLTAGKNRFGPVGLSVPMILDGSTGSIVEAMSAPGGYR
jgi:replicative DNA helicase